uniref:USP domain-containing protein n=1 Tax=Paramoeba aestuarina TaxID=180227 RepID=A0A7S4JW23_9EUKA|mmetsp:Transcript_13463/g.20781  ORF Transcript_13463/g.20781 Transcript_13463/m.20781 type:complete len:1600 (+) Transcript_13463:58-4857(+)
MKGNQERERGVERGGEGKRGKVKGKIEKEQIEEKEEKKKVEELANQPMAFRPADLISEKFFDELFGILPVVSMQDQIWEMLMSLPTNVDVLRAVKELVKEGDQFLFVKQVEDADENQSIFRLLYLMQVIRSLLESEEWLGAFIDTGGLNYLVDIFSNKDLLGGSNGEYGKQTMSHLVDTLNQLFSSGKLDHDKLISCLSNNFVLRLMGQISELAVKPPEEKKSKVEVLKIEEPETSTKKGTRIANCHYSAKEFVLSFDVEGAEHYQVACYCVDYNTDRRIQKMVAWLGDDKKDKDELGTFQKHENSDHLITLKGPAFHNGQWVVWDAHGPGRFNITIASESGPNWVLSSFLLDKSPNPDAEISPFPTLLEIDSESQGKWRGKYGACGGVLLGVKDFKVPVQPGIVGPSPRLQGFDTKKCDRYEWINSLTSDARAMQQAPTLDEIDGEVDDETEVTPLPSAKEVTRMKIEGGESARSTETSRSLLSLLVASSLDREDLLNAVVTYPNLKEWLFTCLIQCDDQKLRQSVVEGIESLCSAKSSCNDCFLECLLGFLVEVEKEQSKPVEPSEKEGDVSPKCFTEYFCLLLSLLKKGEGKNNEQVLQQVYRMLQNHETLEEDDKSDTDTVLLGYLQLVAFLLEGNSKFVQSQDVVRDVFHDCLFGVQENRHAPKIPKCRTRETREAGYNLLCVATKQAHCVHTKVMELLNEQLEKSTLPVDWNIDVFEKSTEERTERTRYVGLKNQGCTCYLNSLVQQLFIIPSLRNDIMNVTVPQDKDNIMYQLQSLFAYMQESRVKYVDTIDFCRTVKLMGQPIVMSRQEDANEFFNSLADQVEPFLKGTPQEHLFKDTFGGKIISQIKSTECNCQSESPQDFLTISLKVQSKRDIYESLDFYVQADMLDGDNKWKCEACNKHVAAKKRACIQHLPNTLALHLIRFEFDYQTFQEVKVNDRFEFPITTTLNMKPYTKEGIAEAEGVPLEEGTIRSDDYYEYELVGCLIHSGTAHSGHYYSYIRERITDDGSDPRWFEFNDRDVTEFRRENLENQAFGGKFNESYGSEKSYSAYMLFYERKNTYEPNKYSDVPLHMGSVALDVSHEKTVEPAILDTIWKDGLTRFHQKLLMTAPTFEFIWSTVSLIPPFEPVLDYEKGLDEDDFTVRVMCFATKFLMDVLSHCMDNLKIIDKIKYLTTLYEKHAPMAGWLLNQMACPDNTWMKNTLSFCLDNDMRTAFAELMCTCIKLIAPYEQKYYFEREPVQPGTAAIVEDEPAEKDKEKEKEKDGDKDKGKEEAEGGSEEKEPPMQPKSVVVRFINRLTALLTAAADKASRTIQQMLYVLLIFARVGSQEKQILMNKNAVSDLISLFELYRHAISQQGSGQQPTDRFVYLIELLAELVVGCDNPAHANHQGEEGVPAPTGMELREENLKKLFDRSFLIAVLRQPYLVAPMTPIFKHWVWGQSETSSSVIRGICYVMDSLYKGREAIVQLIFELLALRDPGFEERIKLTATLLINLVRTNNRLENFRNPFTDLVFSICKEQPIAREHIIKTGGLFDLVEKFPEVDKFVSLNHKEEYEAMLSERVMKGEGEEGEEGEEGGTVPRGLYNNLFR